MKLIDKLLDKSEVLVKVANSVADLASEVYHLTATVATLVETVKLHQLALEELAVRQSVVMKAITGGTDTQLPDINTPDKTPEKPN